MDEYDLAEGVRELGALEVLEHEVLLSLRRVHKLIRELLLENRTPQAMKYNGTVK